MADSFESTEPLDLIKSLLDETIVVKLRGAREIIGKLHAYDSHCNMVLGDATETIYQINDSTKEITPIEKKQSEMIFVRGDSVILFSSPDLDG
ncbi:U4/U6-U5 snRNP complex subunit [Saccharomycopsis crataegensis]|uniref:LSM complex subunit LSM3 n=1 Tax=Saccharomycopsis crataegensis TaxID=43959 RepID=A0AAV5QP61_9ASCO|nr:U4/U6-U5 snRNP complex subunit [Saccharomycopsis crataegensis]